MPARRFRPALALLALAAVPVVAWADAFVTAKGKTVEMPAVESMDCEQIEVTLAKIDLTRYRENTPVPHDRADEPLHRYEKTLAKALFEVCVVNRQSAMQTGEPPEE